MKSNFSLYKIGRRQERTYCSEDDNNDDMALTTCQALFKLNV